MPQALQTLKLNRCGLAQAPAELARRRNLAIVVRSPNPWPMPQPRLSLGPARRFAVQLFGWRFYIYF